MAKKPPRVVPTPDGDTGKVGLFGIASIVKLAKLVIGGQATKPQQIFFFIGILGIVATIAVVGISVMRGEPYLILAALGLLVVAFLFLVFAPSADGASSAELRQENDSLIAELIRLRQTIQDLEAAQKQLEKENFDLTRQVGVHEVGMSKVLLNCLHVYNHLTGAPRSPTILTEQITFVIDANGSLRGKRTRTIQAFQSPQQMLIEVFGGSHPLRHFWDIDLRIRSNGSRQIAVLPAKNDAGLKFALFFLLPELKPEDGPMDMEFDWVWPFLWKPLVDGRIDSWQERVNSPTPVRKLSYRFKFAPELPRIKLENVGHGGGKLLVDGRKDEHGFREYLWEMTDINPGTSIDLKLECVYD